MKTRVVTALILIPIVLGAVAYTSPCGLIACAVLAVWLASSEASTMLQANRWAILLGSLAALTAGAFASFHPSFVFGLLTVPLLAIGCLAAAYSAQRWLWPLIGLWIGAPLGAMLILQAAGMRVGLFDLRSPVLLTLIPLWSGDTAGIFVGKAIGKHPFFPAISPKKTWEGSIGNLVACVIVAIPLAQWLGYSIVTGVLCGVAVGVVGQAGDLFESALKRRSGVKDSGTLLPGHGGLLDRIDSLLFAAPVVAMIVLR